MPLPAASAVSVRVATPGDARALGQLGALLMRMHHDLDGERFVPTAARTARDYAAWLRERLAEPDVVVLVAVRDGEVLGYAYGAVEGHDWMTLRGPAGVLHDLVVDPARRREGVGGRLLDAAVAALRARSAPRVVLSTAARNADAQRFFARAGFRPTMVEMTRELTDDG